MSAFNFVFAYAMSAVEAGKRKEEKGATAVEYALVIGLVSLILVAALVTLKTPLATFVTNIGNKLTVA